MRVVIDTNVFLSAVTDRNLRQREHAEALFRAAARGEIEIAIPQSILFEMTYVLSSVYGRDAATIRTMLRDLVALPGVEIIDQLSFASWMELWERHFPDPADAAVTVVALERGSKVATFDRRFARRLKAAGVSGWWEPDK